MTLDQIRRNFPHKLNDSAFIARNLDAPDTRIGARPVVQKQQNDCAGKKRQALNADHQAGTSGLDGACDHEFDITVTLRISDERDRDNDGAYTTLQDCLIAAVGRLAEMDSLTLRKHAAGAKRIGRRRNKDK